MAINLKISLLFCYYMLNLSLFGIILLYSLVVLQDEIHERDRFCDFLLIVIREMLVKHKNLKLVLMSAALNIQLFSNYFSGCPVINGKLVSVSCINQWLSVLVILILLHQD